LVAWLEAKDEAFVRAMHDVYRRVREIEEGKSGEPSDAEAKATRARLTTASTVPAALDEKQREPLLALLACRTADTSLRGARGLALLGDMRALGALLTISRDADANLRRESARALAALSDPRAKRRLVWMLNDADPQVRDAAFECTKALEPNTLALAQAALRGSEEDVRVRGLDVLVKQGKDSEGAEALLGDSLEDESPKVRGEAFRTLWAWHAKDPLVVIDRALTGRFPDLRMRAVTELDARAKKNDAPSLERLAKSIADRDEGVAMAAYEATQKIKGDKDDATHLAAIASSHPSLRARGAKDAAKAPIEKVRSALTKLLEDIEIGVRTTALESLDVLLPSEPGPLHVGLQSSFLDLRVRAAELLAARRDDQIVNPMQALIADKELLKRRPEIAPLRHRAAVALASLGSPKLLRYFATELVKDEDGLVREQAARGVSNASRRGEEGYLLDLLGHAEVAVRSWAAEGLARLGDARALPVLTGTLRHEHPPIRVGAVLSFAALGPEGYGGMLQGLEDPSRDVQRIVLSIVLARDLRAFRKQESPELLTSALSSERPEVRFAAARALELRIDPAAYLEHLTSVLMPDKPEKAEAMEKWPPEETRYRLMVGLAEALAGDRPEQRYAAAQALRLRDRPIEYFREAQRATSLRSTAAPWVPETTPRRAESAEPGKGPLQLLRKLFAAGAEAASDAPDAVAIPGVATDEQRRLRLLAFGAYVGLLRQASSDDDGHRVRRDAVDRIV
ncbi:MAG TPA: HEAT repeat domain-containing protein, partial [Polyangiaceae bacterium]|nr:HEAT repeat domain-containing protein [Polyangiaceae bacterium]